MRLEFTSLIGLIFLLGAQSCKPKEMSVQKGELTIAGAEGEFVVNDSICFVNLEVSNTMIKIERFSALFQQLVLWKLSSLEKLAYDGVIIKYIDNNGINDDRNTIIGNKELKIFNEKLKSIPKNQSLYRYLADSTTTDWLLRAEFNYEMLKQRSKSKEYDLVPFESFSELLFTLGGEKEVNSQAAFVWLHMFEKLFADEKYWPGYGNHVQKIIQIYKTKSTRV